MRAARTATRSPGYWSPISWRRASPSPRRRDPLNGLKLVGGLSLLLLPERQQPLRGRTADHAGNADRDLAKRRRRNATERDRSDADLAPEVEVAPRVGALGLELIHRGERVFADRAKLHGIGRLDHLAKRYLDGGRLHREFAAKIFAQAGT